MNMVNSYVLITKDFHQKFMDIMNVNFVVKEVTHEKAIDNLYPAIYYGSRIYSGYNL